MSQLSLLRSKTSFLVLNLIQLYFYSIYGQQPNESCVFLCQSLSSAAWETNNIGILITALN